MRVTSLRSIPLAIIGTLALLLSLAGGVAAAEETLTAELEGGEAEVPPGDPDGSGSATIVIDVEEGTLCWEITIENVDPENTATMSHIHVGDPGVAGDVVVGLDTDGFTDSSDGCIEPMEDAAPLQAILDDPEGHYVNVHSEDWPGGAVRGQLAAEAAASPAPNTAVLPVQSSPLVVWGALLILAASLAGLRLFARSR